MFNPYWVWIITKCEIVANKDLETVWKLSPATGTPRGQTNSEP